MPRHPSLLCSYWKIKKNKKTLNQLQSQQSKQLPPCSERQNMAAEMWTPLCEGVELGLGGSERDVRTQAVEIKLMLRSSNCNGVQRGASFSWCLHRCSYILLLLPLIFVIFGHERCGFVTWWSIGAFLVFLVTNLHKKKKKKKEYRDVSPDPQTAGRRITV